MKCKICDNSIPTESFQEKILDKYSIGHYYCQNCKSLQSEKPFWLTEAYKSPISISDTGYMARNIYLSKITLVVFYALFGKSRKYLDYGGGYGVFTRLMRDFGLDFYWFDIFTSNLFSRCFEYKNQPIEAMTSFECFEHFEYPLIEIEKMLSISKTIFFSTILLPKENIPAKEWWYYEFEHGQHITFYSIETLRFIAKRYNLNLVSDGSSLHMLTTRKISQRLFSILLIIDNTPFYHYFKNKMIGKTQSDNNLIAGNIRN